MRLTYSKRDEVSGNPPRDVEVHAWALVEVGTGVPHIHGSAVVDDDDPLKDQYLVVRRYEIATALVRSLNAWGRVYPTERHRHDRGS